MARSGEVKRLIAEATGVPRGSIEQLDRRLGSMGLLPRQRGRYGEHYEPIHLARLLVGVLIMADGIEHSGESVVRVVPLVTKGPFIERVVRLISEGPFIETHEVGTARAGESQAAVEFDQKRAFINVVADVLDRLHASPDGVGSHYLALGLTFGAGAVAGWVESRSAPLHPLNTDYYGQWKKVQGAGFKREARFERSALLKIADLLKPESDES